jgi:Protein of unknown function (DUF1579)
MEAHLSKLVGEWSGTARTWLEPGVVCDESQITGTIRPILDGRFVLHEYSGSMAGKPLSGMAIYGFDMVTNKFQSAWIDSFHMSTGIMFSEGERARSLQFWAVMTRAVWKFHDGVGGPR